MSRLTVYQDDAPGTPILATEDAGAIARELRGVGVRFERWDSPVTLSPEDSAEKILEAYRPYLNGLMGETGAGSADVIKLTPDNPNAAALRQKFLSEHTHTEDEVRFFVHGSGNFIMHVGGRIYDAHCVQGDLISVPAGTRHWFDAGAAPFFTALRVFTDASGWVAQYTGDAISERFPASVATPSAAT
ncbi:1,2-dihydroxy-3-keto-5-methylthiopentene dioxygenase [Limobrevibacterium gyesilva]|uniref:Acireductone dioxygenase n=1 Tax=Limobrevibacterium gyesilva TaxID=2991712 RepID=A0AA41YHF7_9PROT|nr:acireductone dioxygenase [Limobrevibacterium gyesilva]MCW3473369.1 acireductone dioxygenase [Limobrevibacterium gyesilva]